MVIFGLSNVCVMFATSVCGYMYYSLETFENVNVINDDIFIFNGKEHLESFVKDNYPLDYKCDNDNLTKVLCEIVQNIGKEKSLLSIESQIILKMINDSMGLKSKWEKYPNNPELEFMID